LITFVDTNPLVALVDPADSLHATATRDLDRVRRHQLQLPVPVLAEAASLLPAPHLRARLAALIDAYRMAPADESDQVGLRAATFSWLARYGAHRPDWTDGYLCVLSLRDKAKVWTYDPEFYRIWRRADGSRVPLVSHP
jgi:predicted nucleic acid-binding protein